MQGTGRGETVDWTFLYPPRDNQLIHVPLTFLGFFVLDESSAPYN